MNWPSVTWQKALGGPLLWVRATAPASSQANGTIASDRRNNAALVIISSPRRITARENDSVKPHDLSGRPLNSIDSIAAIMPSGGWLSTDRREAIACSESAAASVTRS